VCLIAIRFATFLVLILFFLRLLPWFRSPSAVNDIIVTPCGAAQGHTVATLLSTATGTFTMGSMLAGWGFDLTEPENQNPFCVPIR